MKKPAATDLQNKSKKNLDLIREKIAKIYKSNNNRTKIKSVPKFYRQIIEPTSIIIIKQ